jgi:arylsulfatase A-like enzyme
MSRAPFRSLLATAFLLGFLLATSSSTTVPARDQEARPNILFIITDDQQAHTLGSMHNGLVHTPNLDGLARRGVLFERCYATTAICMASRASLLTGLHEYRTGCNFTTGKVAAKDWFHSAYPVRLRQAGYWLGYGGKWNIRVDGLNWQVEFDQWAGFDDAGGHGFYPTDKNASLTKYAAQYPHVSRALGAFACDFVRNAARQGRPFCLSLGFKAPHIPYDYIDPLDRNLYPDTVFPEPANYGAAASAKLPIQARLSRQYALRGEWDKDHFQANMRLYHQLVSGMDAAVGMVLAELERQGMAGNTVIIFTSDNGHFNGEHGLTDKVLPYEESSRVPLFIVDPRLTTAERQARSRAIVANIDIGPTILAYARVPMPDNLDGKSLEPIVRDFTKTVRKSLPVASTWSWSGSDHSRCLSVITDRWTYTYWAYGDGNVLPAEELYDLENDPHQLRNLAADPSQARALRQMRTAYDEHLGAWAQNTVVDPAYSRLVRIFDRNVPWQDKEFQHFSPSPLIPLYYETGRSEVMKVYRELVGRSAPTSAP